MAVDRRTFREVLGLTAAGRLAADRAPAFAVFQRYPVEGTATTGLT